MAKKLSKKKSTPIQPKKKIVTKTSSSSKTKMVAPKNAVYAVGRRKTASARVKLFPGKQEILVNGRPASKYWPSASQKVRYQLPFKVTNTLTSYTATVKVYGSGLNGQVDAFVHAVARAFDKIDSEKYRPLLKTEKLLTRDPRMKETRKVGRGGKARFKKQSPKR